MQDVIDARECVGVQDGPDGTALVYEGERYTVTDYNPRTGMITLYQEHLS